MLIKSTTNKTTKAIAVASTPLHILYTIEMLYLYQVESAELIILLKRTSDKPQIEEILKEYHWVKIHWVDATKKIINKFISIYELYLTYKIHLLRNDYDYGIFSDYGRTIIANIRCRHYFWLGDGSKIIYETEPDFHSRVDNLKKIKILFKILTRKNLVLESPITIFSPLPLSSCKSEKNNFSWLRSKYNSIEGLSNNDNTVYFFGTYFSERDGKPLMNDTDYLINFKKITRYYQTKNKSIIYIPHRHESEKKLDQIKALHNVSVRSIQYPAEFHFYHDKTTPTHIASFFSTCLFHFHALQLSTSITSFYIDFSIYNEAYKNKAEPIYTALKTTIGKNNIVELKTLS